MSTEFLCPHCGSKRIKYNAIKQYWRCLDEACEETFEGEAPAVSELHPLLADKTTKPKAIFFSYGHDGNKELVDKFKEGLERRGHTVWIDYKHIGTWDDWKGAITKGIHDSELTIAFLSKHATRDPGVCKNEIAMAINRFGTVYPVLLEPVNDVTPPVTISHLQWEDLSQWQAIRDGKVEGQDWARWYEDRLIKLIALLEGDATEFEGDIRSLREVLKPQTFTADIARHITDFTGRKWVFDAYEDWLENRRESRLFWLKAGPGVGKTAIASMLAHAHQSAVVGAWFCQFNSEERRDTRIALCTLAFQLATRWDDYRRKLRYKLGFNACTGPEDWQDLRNELQKKNEADLFNFLFSEPLSGLIWRDHRLVVVIDALDEASDANGQNPLVDLLVTRLAHLPEWLSFVVTSRPNPEVVAKLQCFSPFEMDAHDFRNAEDLSVYLKTGLSRRDDFVVLEAPRQDQIIEILLENSEGMILYLQQILKGLDERLLTLDTIAQAPRGLGSLYRIAFDHLYGGNRLESNYDEEVKPLLRLILAAPEGLPSELAMNVLRWDRETYYRRRNRLGAYVTDTPQGIKLFHKTLYEWLQDESSAPYFLNPHPARKQLAEYLWHCFAEAEGFTREKWSDQIYNWLPGLLTLLPQWDDSESLILFCEYILDRVKKLDLVFVGDVYVRAATRARELKECEKGTEGHSLQHALYLLAYMKLRNFDFRGVGLLAHEAFSARTENRQSLKEKLFKWVNMSFGQEPSVSEFMAHIFQPFRFSLGGVPMASAEVFDNLGLMPALIIMAVDIERNDENARHAEGFDTEDSENAILGFTLRGDWNGFLRGNMNILTSTYLLARELFGYEPRHCSLDTFYEWVFNPEMQKNGLPSVPE